MKRQFTRTDFLLILIPALLWILATYARPFVIQPKCMNDLKSCSKESVLSIDQVSLGMENSEADRYSYTTQNLSGVIATATPLVCATTLFILGKMNPLVAITSMGADLILVLQTTLWNGLLTEVSHLISQRPRPFVYMDPLHRGVDSAHYVSFYSGHTSFTAAATTISFLILMMHKAPWIVLLISGIIGQSLILSTAYFRVLAGRHFLTDVICAAIMGSLIAWVIARHHMSRKDL